MDYEYKHKKYKNKYIKLKEKILQKGGGMNFLVDVWKYQKNLKKDYGIDALDITLQGDAIAARYSGFWIREWKIMLDAGLHSEFNPEHIFITHTHLDHIGRLYEVLLNMKILDRSKPKIYIPRGAKNFVKNYLDSMAQLTSLNFYKRCNRCTLI